jgi:hypothetical protein
VLPAWVLSVAEVPAAGSSVAHAKLTVRADDVSAATPTVAAVIRRTLRRRSVAGMGV